MNYLAHFILAFNDPEILVGQFISDDIKGNQYLNYQGGVRNGILLHRFIDDFTDTHPLCLEIRKDIRQELGLFSGIAIDVYFDYCLSVNWSTHSPQNMEEFIQNVYSVLNANSVVMNEKRRFILSKMQEQDWLGRYKTLEGIDLTLQQMSFRVPEGRKLHKAAGLLEKHEKKVKEIFEIFFPQLTSASKFKLDTFAPLG